MTAITILLCLPIGILNRWARGEGNWPKWSWLAFMYVCALVITGSPIASWAVMYIILAFAVPPTQALLPAVNGNPPGRDDGKWWNWMQVAARWINLRLSMATIPEYWFRFGIIYGIIRGSLTLPGYLFLWGYTGNPWVMAVAVLQLSQGVIYNFFKNVPAGDLCMAIVLWQAMAICNIY